MRCADWRPIAQFIAFFNYTQLPRVAAAEMAHLLEQVDIPSLLLMVLFILVIVLLDFILPGVVPKWAILRLVPARHPARPGLALEP